MEHYDEYHDRVQWKPSEKLHTWVAVRIIREFAKRSGIQGKSVLEIGSGTGRLARALHTGGISNYNGVEPNSRLANSSRMQGFDISEEELPTLPANFQNKFDRVISLHVIEHAPTYLDARTWLEEMIRVTKPGGYILVATPDVLDYQEFFWDSDWSHGYPTTPARVAQIFNDLKADVKFSGSMHLGSTTVIAAVIAHAISFLIPTRPVDFLTKKMVNRPLASGLEIALLWGLTIVIVQKRTETI
jgi:SAM-dependent methyltransferase